MKHQIIQLVDQSMTVNDLYAAATALAEIAPGDALVSFTVHTREDGSQRDPIIIHNVVGIVVKWESWCTHTAG